MVMLADAFAHVRLNGTASQIRCEVKKRNKKDLREFAEKTHCLSKKFKIIEKLFFYRRKFIFIEKSAK